MFGSIFCYDLNNFSIYSLFQDTQEFILGSSSSVRSILGHYLLSCGQTLENKMQTIDIVCGIEEPLVRG